MPISIKLLSKSVAANRPRTSRSVWIAGAAATAVSVWMLSGLFASDEGANPADAVTNSASAGATIPEIPTVRTRAIIAEPYQRILVARGQTEAVRSVVIKAETAGRVVEIGAPKGSAMDAGALIARLDMDDREARLAKARALVNQRNIEYQATAKLQSRGFAADTKKAESQAQLAEARAELRSMEMEIEDTTVSAPFDGVLEARVVEIGDYVQVGDPIATLVDLNPILFTASINERNRDRIALGQTGIARTITGTVRKGTVRFIAAQANEDTRTFRIEMEVDNTDGAIPAGMTADLELTGGEVLAHRLTPALLSLDDSGVLGVKLVEDNTVRFRPVSVISDTTDGIWIDGLPREATIITVGQEFVRDGQTVTPVDEATIGNPAPARDSPAAPVAERQESASPSSVKDATATASQIADRDRENPENPQ